MYSTFEIWIPSLYPGNRYRPEVGYQTVVWPDPNTTEHLQLSDAGTDWKQTWQHQHPVCMYVCVCECVWVWEGNFKDTCILRPSTWGHIWDNNINYLAVSFVERLLYPHHRNSYYVKTVIWDLESILLLRPYVRGYPIRRFTVHTHVYIFSHQMY